MPFSHYSVDFSDRTRSTTPPVCPKCQSPDTCSASKRPTSDSYWRCLRCGDVWNPSLLVGAPSQRQWHR